MRSIRSTAPVMVTLSKGTPCKMMGGACAQVSRGSLSLVRKPFVASRTIATLACCMVAMSQRNDISATNVMGRLPPFGLARDGRRAVKVGFLPTLVLGHHLLFTNRLRGLF